MLMLADHWRAPGMPSNMTPIILQACMVYFFVTRAAVQSPLTRKPDWSHSQACHGCLQRLKARIYMGAGTGTLQHFLQVRFPNDPPVTAA
jgi:hypothetical protein